MAMTKQEQLDYLASKIKNSVVVVGDTPKKLRQEYLKAADEGKVTYQLAKEGLSVDRLDTLIFASPVKFHAIVTQSIGRIQRPFEGKYTATVYDLVDSEAGTLYNMYTKRRAVYRKNKWVINNTYLED